MRIGAPFNWSKVQYGKPTECCTQRKYLANESVRRFENMKLPNQEKRKHERNNKC